MARKTVPRTAHKRDPYFDVKRSLLGDAVYFVLREPLQREQFLQASAILRSRAESSTGVAPEAHWEHLQQRLTGEQPAWNVLVPHFDGPFLSPDDGVRFRAGWHSVANIATVRGYSRYRLDGLECTLDYFNPRNEIGLLHRTVDETVVAVVLAGRSLGLGGDESLRDLRDDLRTADVFFETLKALDAVLAPEWVLGSHSLASVVLAQLEGRIATDIRPWEFCYPLSVFPIPDSRTLAELQGDISWRVAGPTNKVPEGTFRFGRVDEWSAGRVLVVADGGFSASMSWVFEAAAQLLGRTNANYAVEPVVTFHRDESGRVAFHRHRRRMDKSRPSEN